MYSLIETDSLVFLSPNQNAQADEGSGVVHACASNGGGAAGCSVASFSVQEMLHLLQDENVEERDAFYKQQVDEEVRRLWAFMAKRQLLVASIV